MNTDIQIAVSNALAAQPWWVRRKDTITAIAGTIMQLANVAVAYTADGPEWVNVAIALLIGLCQVVIHAGTKGAITDSMAGRLSEHAPDHTDDGYEAGVQAAEQAGEAVPNPYDVAYEDGSTVYGGEHRADQPLA